MLAHLSLEMGIPPSELRRRMTMRDWMMLIAYFEHMNSEEKGSMPSSPQDLMKGF